jgi:hypothetical protein
MARPARGTAEWFKREKLDLLKHLKAVDSFAAAAGNFQKLVELGHTTETEVVGAALHTAGVIHYARPFIEKNRFRSGIIKKHSDYDERIHRQLIDLRNKLIAHSDSDYADARLFRKELSFEDKNGSVEFKVLVGGSLLTQTVHMIDDPALAKRCLIHVTAVATTAHSDLRRRFEEFARAGQECPAALEAAASIEPRSPIKLEPFQASNAVLNPHAVLTKPPLIIQDGYAYRALTVQIDVPTEVIRQDDDGSESRFWWGPVSHPDERQGETESANTTQAVKRELEEDSSR